MADYAPWDYRSMMKERGLVDPANPNDPNQQAQWATGLAQANANKPLYDEATLTKLKSIFGPLFASQTQNLTGQMNQARGQTGQQAGAFAASQGLANPGSFTSGAQNRVTQAFAPQFANLQSNQLGQLLNAGAQSSQFGAQNNLALAQLMMQKAQYDQQQQNQPSIWDYVLGGLASGAGKAGMAALLG
jgi:hypothetical protein